jgi:DNA repair exonuclease SbcCD ATPase subunit
MANPFIADPMGEALSRYGQRLTALEDAQMRYMQKTLELEARMTQLERLVLYPNDVKQDAAAIKSQAAQHQATEHLYAPLRSDTRAVIDLAAFARRLIDMQDLGHAVTDEVRELAKRALGLK